MRKYTLLGCFNVILSIFFFWLLFFSLQTFASLSWASLIHGYLPDLIISFSATLNAFLAYKLLLSKEKVTQIRIYILFAFFSVFWFLFLFVGYFFASDLSIPVGTIILVVCIFYFVKKVSYKTALFLSIMTILVSFVVIVSGFEEDYCLGKGVQADPTGRHLIIATQEDMNSLQGFNIKPGDQIGVAFKAHMLCHNSFNLPKALQEKYFYH